MLCYISQPNNQLLEIEIDPKQTGQVVLDKVLEKLGILELDFFGLQYKGPKREELWLNLRNRVCDHEICGSAHLYRFSLRVKFFVPPHLVQQECTKELFYAQAKDAMEKELIDLSDPECDEDSVARIVAAITQAEQGDQTCNIHQQTDYEETLKKVCPSYKLKSSTIDKIHSEHSKLHGVPRASARYFMLKEASIFPGYGMERHKVLDTQGAEVNFDVGPEGVTLRDCKSHTQRKIPYSQIRLATHNEKMVQIELIDDAGELQAQECVKLVSRKAAVALYRCITEMHSFYRCDTVCSDVHSQYSRDFKGTFVSIFSENSDLGKRFIFDIQRTRQEAYDFVRRKLYAKSSSPAGSPIHCMYSSSATLNGNEEDNETSESENGVMDNDNDSGAAAVLSSNKNLQKEMKQLKRRLESVQDSLLCCICMYKQVCIVLCPCGHMTCDVCADRITQCPQCRTDVDNFQKVFQGFGNGSYKVSKENEQLMV